ncbi:unnamed protein product [Rhizophagus irregularis]|nr:unnamed protein product [Rhizophagus irregularis]
MRQKKDKIWEYLEPELYELVKKHQIYTCDSHYDLSSLRYIYCYTKEEDLYVVLYHTPTLFLWNGQNGHVNFHKMFRLLFGYSICRSTIAIEFLPSISPKVRNKSVKPPYVLQQEEQLSPY